MLMGRAIWPTTQAFEMRKSLRIERNDTGD